MSMADGAPEPNTLIGEKYRVAGVIGRGGMGCLVKAEHLLLKKSVAIKFVLAGRSGSQRRLFREARAAQSLSCEQVVRVFDIGVHKGAPYIVMELLEGSDLSRRVRAEGPLPIEEAVDSLIEACVAVAEAHARGIVHRDIKPSNLFAARTPTRQLVKVLDFGISKVPEPLDAEDCERTAEGMILGTPHYTSPEQLRNPANIDGRADIWALGVTLFHLLSGEHPFPGPNAREIMAAIFSDSPIPLTDVRPEVPEPLWHVIRATLSKRPEERTPDVEALVRQLLPFASKRGSLAAEQILGAEPPAALQATTPTADDTPSALDATDAGLTSTLAPPGQSTSKAPPVRDPRRRIQLVMAATVLALAAASSWLLTRDTTQPALGLSPVALQSNAKRASPQPPAGSAFASAVVHVTADEVAAPAKTAATRKGAPTAQRESKPRAPEARAPRSAAPAAVPSASAAAPASAVKSRDVDGVPIVD